MSTNVYSKVLYCHIGLRLEAKAKNQRQLRLFLPSGPLEYIAIDILGLLLQSRSGSQFVTITIDQYSELTRTIPTPKI